MDPELLAIFEAEMTSNLEDLEQVLLEMESEPTKTELANDAFRVAHNLKGGAGLMEMETLGSLAHTAEELLEAEKTAEWFFAAFRDEDYTAQQQVQDGLSSLADKHMIIGRNEIAVQHAHETARRLLAGEPVLGPR